MKRKLNLLFRLNCSYKIGFGHFYRCINFLDHFSSFNKVYFIINPEFSQTGLEYIIQKKKGKVFFLKENYTFDDDLLFTSKVIL